MLLKIKKIKDNARIPKRATNGSAGMDLYACINESITLNPGQLALVPTGIAIELPDNGCAAFLYARSGLGVKHGICLSNGVGVIDSDYRGEVCVGLCNVSDKAYTIEPGVLPTISLACEPTASTLSVRKSTATTDGSRRIIPLPFTQTSVFAVPRSIPISFENENISTAP